MKKLITLLLLMSTPVFAAKISDSQLELGRESAADNKEILFNVGEGSGNPKIRANYSTKKLEFTNDGTNFAEFGTGGDLGGYNVIDNPGFESDLTNWTNTGSGSLSVDTDAADVYQGNKSALWDAAAASDVLASQAVTIPGGLRGNLCSVEVQYKGGDDNLKLQAYDGTNVLAEVALVASANFSKAMVTFTCPNSGTIQGRIIASADAAAVNVDNWVVGKSADILNYSASSEWQDWTPTYAGSNSMTFTSVTTYVARYRVVGNGVEFYLHFEGTTGGTANEYISASLPINAADDSTSSGVGPYSFSVQYQNGVASTLIPGSGMIFPLGGVTQLRIGRQDNTDFGLGTNREFIVTGFYEIDPNDAPLNVNPIQRVETSAWHVDVNFDGTFVNNGTSSDSTSNLPSSSVLAISQNKGSIDAKIMCDGAVPGTTTCPSSNELPGIAFNSPRAGAAYVCVTGLFKIFEGSGTTDLYQFFRPYQVSTDGTVNSGLLGTNWSSIDSLNNTSFAFRKDIEPYGGISTLNNEDPFTICGIANLTAGENGFVLAERTAVNTGTPSGNEMAVLNWTVFPIEQQLPQAILLSNIDADKITIGTLDEDRLPATINNVRTIAASGSTGVTSNGNATNFARITLPTNLGYGLSGGVAHITLASADQLYAATVSFDRQQNSNLIVARIIASSGNGTFMGTISLSQSGNELRFNYNAASGNSGVVRATIIVQTVVPDVSISF